MDTTTTHESAAPLQAVDDKFDDLLWGIDNLLLAVQIAGLDKEIEAAQPALWNAAFQLTSVPKERGDTAIQQQRALGFFLALQALGAVPDVLPKTLTVLRARLFAGAAPLLQQIRGEVAGKPPADHPVPHASERPSHLHDP